MLKIEIRTIGFAWIFLIFLISAISLSNLNDFIVFGQEKPNSFIEDNYRDESALTVGSYPVGIDVNPITAKLYIANEFSNTISVIDTKLDKIQDTIKVNNFPYDIDVNPFSNRIYVTNRGSDTVSVIDGSTNSQLSNISVGKSPIGIAINPKENWVYVANIDSQTISVIDSIVNQVVDSIKLEGLPYDIGVNPLTNKIYVSNLDKKNVHVIDGNTNKIIKEIKVGNGPSGLFVNFENNIIYVTNFIDNTVSVINGTNNEVYATIDVGKSPVSVAVNPILNKIYTANIGDNSISIINGTTNKEIKKIYVNATTTGFYKSNDPILNLPQKVQFPLLSNHISINPDTNRIYITNTVSNSISIIDGTTDSIVVRMFINVNPPNSGRVECNGLKVESGSSVVFQNNIPVECVGIPGRGFSFDYWSNMVSSSQNPLILDTPKYGELNVNFKPTLLTEQYVFMIMGIIGSSSVLAGFILRRRERRYLNRYMTRIDSTYDTLQENDRMACIQQLESIRKEITRLFRKGRLTDSHYNILDKKISEYLQKLYNMQ